VDALRAAGHDVVCVAEVAPGARDEEVLGLANAQARLILTNDKDFGELVYRDGRVSQGVVLLRFAAEDGRERAARLADVPPSIMERLPGHFAVLSEQGVRLRPLRRAQTP
jgi:predicted nuclease of predicted toxin-antitoxin system